MAFYRVLPISAKPTFGERLPETTLGQEVNGTSSSAFNEIALGLVYTVWSASTRLFAGLSLEILQ